MTSDLTECLVFSNPCTMPKGTISETLTEEQPGCALIKQEFLKPISPHQSCVGLIEPSKIKKKRKEEKLDIKTYGSEKFCPYLVVPFPEAETKDVILCPYFETGCRYSHDLAKALREKPEDLPGLCPVLSALGRCSKGQFCRWASSHSTHPNAPSDSKPVELVNDLSSAVRSQLQKNTYSYKRADEIVQLFSAPQAQNSVIDESTRGPKGHSVNSADGEGIRLRSVEKTKVDFRNKLYLAPLTTVGNLPFRRVCRQLGAEITCGEMAVATQILQGKQSELALLRRHPSETIFGVQLCGAHVNTMTRAAQLLDEQCDVDFVDVNCGCPIDLVWKKGAGAGLLSHANRLSSIVQAMDQALNKAQVTVKMRTGVRESKNLAHQLIPKLYEAGASLITLHGRSREQRYTRLADWGYVRECASIARPGLLFGNGDVLSYEDYIRHKEITGVDGIMIARGALIKPWIFTEIKEARVWDISASERLDILRQFTNHGLELWGSDIRGVETTRRFLLEWLSFLYRYIPYGLLERVPQKINERPPAYFGRNDLETLMASEKCLDWIRISELLLGPIPEGFSFTPRHKANAYSK